ncbi:TonB-dependent receptor [uncultured Polaribacter sp.]|uniref:SusC/RagA family TonB-linked outer membrane protein n=1 Tax=uncultured Polaribacter sp. TaxID=174711 RepID=UPI0026132B00|nr:TonB-dependent receptor [uncultured Polaribacter sp.]
MKKILTIFLVTLSVHLFSQEKIISGTVVDETGQPLLGVSVLIKGASKGTTTDFDGVYNINAKTGDVLVFAYLGTESKEVKVGNNNKINVTLVNDDTTLDEIVVIGYGSVKKSDLTGSVSTIKSEAIENVAAVNFEEALAGRAAGVVVTASSGEPGSPVSIQIRGISSLNDTQPLYIIDGVQMENTFETGLAGNETNLIAASLSPLAMLNQSDIESIEILKDASATSIYGSRGASGVVLITTKQGKVGKGVVNVTQDFGISTVQRFLDLLDGNQWQIMNNERVLNAGTPLNAEENFLQEQALAGNLETNNWQKLIATAGTQSNTNLSISGGTKDVKYYLSGGLLKTSGPVLGSDFNRVSTRARINANVSKKISVAANVSFSRQQTTRVASGSGGAFNRAIRANPISGINLDQGEGDLGDDETFANPIQDITRTINNTLQSQFVGQVDLRYNFTESLFFKTSYSFQERNTSQRYYQSVLLNSDGVARTQDTRRTRETIENTLNFNKKFGKSNINAVLGQEIQETVNEGIRVRNSGFPNDLLTYYEPGIAEFNDPDVVTYSKDILSAFLGRVNYALNNKYLFTLTGRFDGSSRFAANNKWSFFNSAAFAYKLGEEEFIKNIDAISQMKFRVTYGSSGNQTIGTYQSLDQYEASITPFGESTTPIYYQNQLPNANLFWETTKQIDAGLDLGLFKNRFSLTLDYYNKITDDLLFVGQRIPAQSGFTEYTQNNGALDTKGFEVSVDAKIIRGKKFKWNLNANASTARTIITDLKADFTFSGWDPGFISGGTQRLIIGEEVGAFYGYKTAGIAQFDDLASFQGLTNQERIDLYNTNRGVGHDFVDGYSGGLPFIDAGNGAGVQAHPGDQLYEDLNGDGVITDEDRQIIGRAQPDVSLGLTNTFSFGNFDVSVYVDSQIGKDVHNHSSIALLNFVGLNNSSAVAYNRWTPENPSDVYPRISTTANLGGTRYSDRYLEDGSFVRLQNVTLSYRFNKKLTDKLKISSLRLYASGSNLAIWTKYTGYTPDVNARRGNTSLGHDMSNSPPRRLIRMGLNMKF